MTRLFTKILCERCNKQRGDTAYVRGKKHIIDGLCFTCKIKDWKKEQNK